MKQNIHWFIGPECDKLFSKLDDLEEYVIEQSMTIDNPSFLSFIETLRYLKEVNLIAHKQKLDPNHIAIVNKSWKFKDEIEWDFWGSNYSENGVVFEHLPEIFERTGETLLTRTDQTVEATHSRLDKFIKMHNYQIRDVTSEKAGENLLNAFKHFNNYNLG